MASPLSKGVNGAETRASPSELMSYIHDNELGADMSIQTPFGVRQVLYADYTASGRALAFIEDYVRAALLPTYGNTHTSTTKTGRQSSDFVAEVRCPACGICAGSDLSLAYEWCRPVLRRE